MAPSLAIRPRTAGSRPLAILITCLLIVRLGDAHSSAQVQAAPHSDANQLHEANVNGDVESLIGVLT